MFADLRRSVDSRVDGLAWMGNGARGIFAFVIAVLTKSSRKGLVEFSARPISATLKKCTAVCGTLHYMIRDRDGAYGATFIRRVAAMGIRNRQTSARSPWQNGCAERLIGSVRRECLDQIVVFGERHLRHLLNSY